MQDRCVIIAGSAVPEDWDFRRGLEETSGKHWEVLRCITNEFGGIRKITRYLKYLLFPLGLFLKRNRFTDLISWDQFFGLVLAYYCRVFHVRKCPAIDVVTFIYKPKRGLIGKIYESFVRKAVTSKYIRNIYVFSTSEVGFYADHFHVPRSLFIPETLGIHDLAPQFAKAESADADAYFLAAGRSNRDYDFLRAAWPKDENEMRVICDTEKAEDRDNIRYYKNCHGDEYLSLLSACYAAFVPLADEHISSGQLVCIQAAMLGKPVISTKNDTISEYIEDGVTGFIIDKTPQALRAALSRLRDRETYLCMCRAGRAAFERRFSLLELGRRIGRRFAAGIDPKSKP